MHRMYKLIVRYSPFNFTWFLVSRFYSDQPTCYLLPNSFDSHFLDTLCPCSTLRRGMTDRNCENYLNIIDFRISQLTWQNVEGLLDWNLMENSWAGFQHNLLAGHVDWNQKRKVYAGKLCKKDKSSSLMSAWKKDYRHHFCATVFCFSRRYLELLVTTLLSQLL